MGFKPNKYQEAIYDFILNGEGNAVINAVAGSGKSTTIVNALNIIDSSKTVLFLAFNKSIVDELKRKIGEKPNVQIKTLHSLGSSICYKEFHSTINADKYTKYINKCIKEGKFKPTKRLSRNEMSSWARNIRELCNLGRIELCTDQFSMRDVATKHDILLEDNEIECAVKAIKWGEKDVSEIDFSDMIYFPNVKKVDVPTFDFVFIDECQDLNAAQRELFLKLIDPDDGRFIAVGDRNQCQPEGTIIETMYGQKKIEDFSIGDTVVSYVPSEGRWHGKNKNNRWSVLNKPVIQDIHKEKYCGNLIKIKAGKYTSRYTPDHICMVRLDPSLTPEQRFVYLMAKETENGTDWRIGKSQAYVQPQKFGPRLRLQTEKGDKLWILRVCKDNDEAKMWEEIYATKYGISQKCFEGYNSPENYTFAKQENIKFVFEQIRECVNESVDKLFEDLGLLKEYPLIEKEADRNKHISKFHIFPCRACNIIEGCTQVLTYDGTYEFVEKSTEHYDGYVYSLKVDRTYYVADGILTHNCIYSFAGADNESFNKLISRPNTKEYPLSVCYRCDKSIVEKAQKLVPQIEYNEGAEEGVIDMEAKLEDVKDGDMVICRVSAPLVSLCMKFIKDGVKAYVKGKDIGANLIGMLRKTGKDTVREAIDSMREERHELIKKICNLNGYDEEEARNTSAYQAYKDKFDAIRYLCEGYDKTEDVIKRIEEIFSDTNGKGICLSTVHKAKGLENDRVFILNGDKFYPKWAMKNKVQATQEKNLEYVAITRPKKYLGYITYNVLI